MKLEVNSCNKIPIKLTNHVRVISDVRAAAVQDRFLQRVMIILKIVVKIYQMKNK